MRCNSMKLIVIGLGSWEQEELPYCQNTLLIFQFVELT